MLSRSRSWLSFTSAAVCHRITNKAKAGLQPTIVNYILTLLQLPPHRRQPSLVVEWAAMGRNGPHIFVECENWPQRQAKIFYI